MITETKNTLEAINSRLDDTGEWISDWKTVEVIESEQQQKEFLKMRIH